MVNVVRLASVVSGVMCAVAAGCGGNVNSSGAAGDAGNGGGSGATGSGAEAGQTATGGSGVGAGGSGGNAGATVGGSGGAAGIGQAGTGGGGNNGGGGSGTGGGSGVGGGSGAGGSGSGGSAGGMGTPTIMAVGWNGLKIRSRDLGLTWTNRVKLVEQNRYDDGTLIRQIAYGAGMWVAGGNNLYSSPDGVTWTMRMNAQDNFVGGLAFGNGLFVAAGWNGVNMRSTDGINWIKGARNVGNASVRSAAFGNGQFAVQNDNSEVYLTSDGITWTLSPTLRTNHVGFCNGAFRAARDCLPITGFGIFLRTSGNAIERSVDGRIWKAVHVEPANVGPSWYTEFDTFGFGYSP